MSQLIEPSLLGASIVVEQIQIAFLTNTFLLLLEPSALGANKVVGLLPLRPLPDHWDDHEDCDDDCDDCDDDC